jgi:hypothetical protein
MRDIFTEPTPLERDNLFHRAHLFDRNMVRFQGLIEILYGSSQTIDEKIYIAADMALESLVKCEWIQWPKA